MLRKLLTFLIIIIIVLTPFNLEANTINLETEISAKSTAVIDVSSKRLLYGDNYHQKLPIASITKIMTAILILERGNLEDIVIISENAASIGGSSVWLEEGERKTVEELLYGLILISGNDAAVALAEYLAGEVDIFAASMTAKAKEIGALNTSFKNPHGLDDENHYSTAYDMAIIASYALQVPGFKEIASTREKYISWTNRPWNRLLMNQNQLLEDYPGANGVKTGWTTPAGRCFVGSARKNQQDIVVVVLNAPNMWQDAALLLDYAFSNYPAQTVIRNRQSLITVPVAGKKEDKLILKAGESFQYPLFESEKNKLSYHFITKELYGPPIKSGEKMGMLEIKLDEIKVGEIPLLAAKTIERDGIIHNFSSWLRRLFAQLKEVFYSG